MTQLKPHRVFAKTLAKNSENKMHDDAVARRFGFQGGLVPGVDVFAYMSHIPAAAAVWRSCRAARGPHVHGKSCREELRVPQSKVVPNMIAIIRHVVAVGKPADDLGAPFATDQDGQYREPDGKEPDVGQQPDVEAVSLRLLL